MKFDKKIIYILFGMFLLVPFGLITGYSAWGEWDNTYYKEVLGFIPKGIENAKSINSIMPDYTIKGFGSIAGYYISAIVGVILVFGIFYIIAKVQNSAKQN